MKKVFALPILLGSLASANLLAASSSSESALKWIQQFGTTQVDSASSVVFGQRGDVYVGGYTFGNLGEEPAPQSQYGFVGKFSSTGERQWIRQIGSVEGNAIFAVASDAIGNVFATGYTLGALEGQNLGRSDAFVAKFDSMGSLLWTRQLGSSSYDYGRGIACDKFGNIYVTGRTEGALDGSTTEGIDSFVAKYDSTGSLLWKQQLINSSFDESNGISTDSMGNVYIAGRKFQGSGPSTSDVLLAKFDTTGILVWQQTFGTLMEDEATEVSVDALGNVYVGGLTDGDLGGPNAGSADGFVAKFNTDGVRLWTQQFGTSEADFVRDITADELGHVYATGQSAGNIFISKYGETGLMLSYQPFATQLIDCSGIAYGSNQLLVAGDVSEALGNSYFGEVDAFLAMVHIVPEPKTSAIAVAMLPLLVRRSVFGCHQI